MSELDTKLIAELRTRLEVATKRAEHLEAVLANEAEELERDGKWDERHSSLYWYTQWTEGNRRRAELVLAAERERQRIAEALALHHCATVPEIVEQIHQLRGVVR